MALAQVAGSFVGEMQLSRVFVSLSAGAQVAAGRQM